MRRFVVVFTFLFFSVCNADSTRGDIVVINLLKDGTIRFALSNNNVEEQCREGSAWFNIVKCPENATQCIAASNRMSGLLLSTKLAGKQVTVRHNGCIVDEINYRN